MRLNDLNVIITATGAPGAPGIIKSLRLNGERNIRVIGTDMNPEAVGLSMVDKSYVVPSGRSEEFIPTMLEIAKDEDIDAILPLATYELIPFSRNREKFEGVGTRVLVSNPRSLEIANNKVKLLEFLKKKGIPTPRFMISRNLKEFERAVHKLGYPDSPVCFKPGISKGSRGFRILRDDMNELDLLLNYKPEQTGVYSTLDRIIPVLENADPFPELVVMEYLPGEEYSVDLLVRNGEPLITVPRLREAIKLGISFIGRVEDNSEVEDMANRIVNSLNLDYNINLQLRYSEDRIPKIIEINPRVSGTIVLCTASGVNLPYLGIKLALGEEIPKSKPEYGTKMIRYWEEIYKKNGETFTIGDRIKKIPKV